MKVEPETFEIYLPMRIEDARTYEIFEGRVRLEFAVGAPWYHLERLLLFVKRYYYDTIVTVVP